MPLNLSGAIRTLTDTFQNRTLRLSAADAARLGVPESGRCGLSANSGRIEELEATEGRRQVRGEYTLSLPPDTAFAALPEELEFTIDEEPGRLFTIVWAPAMGNLGLSRRYQVSEVR